MAGSSTGKRRTRVASRAFVDTNILVYKVEGEERKSEIAERLLALAPCISVQNLNEFANVALRKLRLNWDEIHLALDHFRDACEILPLTEQVHDRALEIAEMHKIAIYDALVVAAAQLAGCDVLYTEDMSHGQRIGSVTLRNPFA
jgi:predicted nucleic acid-binding protein